MNEMTGKRRTRARSTISLHPFDRAPSTGGQARQARGEAPEVLTLFDIAQRRQRRGDDEKRDLRETRLSRSHRVHGDRMNQTAKTHHVTPLSRAT